MGEIGYNRHEFLHELKWWEIKLIIRGYRKRERTFCTMTRWAAFMTVSAFADLKKVGIHSAEDLLRFPWEKTELPSEEDIEELRQLLKNENKKRDTEA